MPEIRVHENALAHLSRGLYRSPASALRELVSNAWDAAATEVRISTNYPTFLRLVIEDNGVGFSRAAFVNLMDGGIGNSEKRAESRADNPDAELFRKFKAERKIPDRPVIGRLGIGLLGIAQICGSFFVTSRCADGTGFRAEVKLFDSLQERIENETRTEGDYVIVRLGFYEFDDDFDPNSVRQGTIISSDDVSPMFAQTFNESLHSPKFKQPPLVWRDALKTLSSVSVLQELCDYWRLLWELSVAAPVPYIASNVVPQHSIAHDQSALEAANFKVIVDNIELRKPIRLVGNPGGYTVFDIPKTELMAYKRRLSFHGYIVVQEGAQLKPDELRGILIRIKNIAVGYYDQQMLDYRVNHGPRSRWLTGEIYVDEGLEDALNVDRDSFNRFHPQYKALQQYVHGILDKKIFPEVYKKLEKRSEVRAVKKREQQTSHFRAVLESTSGERVAVRVSSSASTVESRISSGTRGINVILPSDISKRPYKLLVAAILALFDIAMKKRSVEEKRETFQAALYDLLSKW